MPLFCHWMLDVERLLAKAFGVERCLFSIRDTASFAKATACHQGRSHIAYGLGGPPLFMNGVNKSIGTGRNVVVLCSLEISRMVWRKRSCSAMGSLLIIAAACTIFSAA